MLEEIVSRLLSSVPKRVITTVLTNHEALNYLVAALVGKLSPTEAIDYILAEVDIGLQDSRTPIQRLYILFRSSPILVALLFERGGVDQRVIDYHPLLFQYQPGLRESLPQLALQHPDLFEGELHHRINEALILSLTCPTIASELYKRGIISSLDLKVLSIHASLSDNKGLLEQLVRRGLYTDKRKSRK